MKKFLSILLCMMMMLTYISPALAAVSSNASLSDIVINDGYYGVNPVFSSRVYAYTVEVLDKETGISIKPETASSASTININGTAIENGSAYEFTLGNTAEENTVSIEVTAENGTTVKTYNLTINRVPYTFPDSLDTPLEYSNSDYAVYGKKMAAGIKHIAVVKPNGKVAVWGNNDGHQLDVPEELANDKVTAVAAGETHTLALTEDGRVFAWGSVCIDSSLDDAPVSIPDSVNNVQGHIKLIVAGGNMSAVVTDTNQVITWGFAVSTAVTNEIPSPADFGDIVSMAINNHCAIALNKDGKVTVWGDSSCTDYNTGLITGSNVVSVAAGQKYWLALLNDGKVIVTGAEKDIRQCRGIQYENGVRAIGSGWLSTSAVLDDGSIMVWNKYPTETGGYLGKPDGEVITGPEDNIAALSTTVVNEVIICAMKDDGSLFVRAAPAATDWALVNNMPSGLNLRHMAEPGADLKALTVDGYTLSPSFDPDTTDYSISVPSVVESVYVTADVSYDSAALKINGNDAVKNVTQAVYIGSGDTMITIGVSAGDDISKTYTVDVKRAAETAKSSNADLKSLSISHDGTGYPLSTNFDADTVAYSVYVPGTVVSVEIMAETSDDGAALKIYGKNAVSGVAEAVYLAQGDTTIPIVVTAEDGTVKTYTVVAGRTADSGKSSDSSLSSLSVDGYALSPAFSSGITGYSVAVSEDVTSLDITAVASDGGATFEINGKDAKSSVAEAVYVGAGTAVVTIAVTAEDGIHHSSYTINVGRESGSVPQGPGLAAGTFHAAAVLQDGTVAAWGDNTYGQLNVSPGTRDVKALAAGMNHTLALNSAGKVTAWGRNSNGQCNIPDALQDRSVIAIAAGPDCSAALTADKQLYVWGVFGWNLQFSSITLDLNAIDSLSGKTVSAIALSRFYLMAVDSDGNVTCWDCSSGTYELCDTPEAFVQNIAVISAFYNNILGLKSDGTVVCWDSTAYAVPAGLPGVKAVAAGRAFCAALGIDGKVYAWGDNKYGQCNVPEGLENVQALAAGDYDVYALKEDGTVLSWGWNKSGEGDVPSGLNLSSMVSSNNMLESLSVVDRNGKEAVLMPSFGSAGTEFAVDVLGEKVDITAQAFSSKAALKINGDTMENGAAKTLYLGAEGSTTAVTVAVTAEDGKIRSYVLNIKRVDGSFTLPETPEGYRAGKDAAYAGLISTSYSGDRVLAVKKDGKVVAWGNNPTNHGQGNVPAGLKDVIAVAAGSNKSLALKKDGTVTEWGYKGYYGNKWSAMPEGLKDIVDISAYWNAYGAVDKNGKAYVWGDNQYGQCDIPDGLTGVADIACGFKHVLVLKSDGTVAAWGDNANGQCDVPVGLEHVIAVAAGISRSMALKADGTVAVWGKNTAGLKINSLEPQYIRAISAGGKYCTAVKWDGSLIVWGDLNGVRDENIDIGIADPLDKKVIAESAGGELLVALYEDGSLGAWMKYDKYSYNMYSQLDVPEGLNLFADDTEYTGPVPAIPQTPAAYADSIYMKANDKLYCGTSSFGIKADGTVKRLSYHSDVDMGVPDGLENVKALAYSGGTVMALQEDGKVVVWGYDGDGQCNVPETCNTGVTAIAASTGYATSAHCMALMSDGTVEAWGNSYYGQCDVPEALTGVTAISAGYDHSLALKDDGTVAAWGHNDCGQCDVPEGLSDVACIYASYRFSAALKNDGTVVAWGDNSLGQCDVPEGLSGVVYVSVSNYTCAALKSNGTVAVWGHNDYGVRNVPVGLHDVTYVNIEGSNYVTAVKTDGTIMGWGYQKHRKCLEDYTNVLAVKGMTVIFRDGSAEYADKSYSHYDEINDFLSGLNVLRGHYLTTEDVELTDANGESIQTVFAGGSCRINAKISNICSEAKKGLVIIQLRGGEGAAAGGGGRVLGCTAKDGDIPAFGESTASADFIIPGDIGGTVYADVFVWNGWDEMVPNAEPVQTLQFTVTQ
ncbi:cadherin-like beta sandwich domain-containing protein [Petroclostridium sp. X23]|uniref:cadherin-like beta sandwich domain-containing protein n=1 Tax=Petroclostridium sp. X23 TaxID=3045146 RepID=UPI0024ADC987|nr:cadherin-like beta sandwich domain-containing protein [Petroclostridium sp. X23]WHH57762.1 cadherin-like beta sandwich domain-containing protein [Petroclostridium sp. X23]